jgi:hypothetical protein
MSGLGGGRLLGVPDPSCFHAALHLDGDAKANYDDRDTGYGANCLDGDGGIRTLGLNGLVHVFPFIGVSL